MVAEFEADLIRMRTREGMALARARGRLKGRAPSLSPADAGTYSTSSTPATTPTPNCSTSPATVYREIRRRAGCLELIADSAEAGT